MRGGFGGWIPSQGHTTWGTKKRTWAGHYHSRAQGLDLVQQRHDPVYLGFLGTRAAGWYVRVVSGQGVAKRMVEWFLLLFRLVFEPFLLYSFQHTALDHGLCCTASTRHHHGVMARLRRMTMDMAVVYTPPTVLVQCVFLFNQCRHQFHA